MSLLDVLAAGPPGYRHGLRNPTVTIRAAADAGLELAPACVALMDETAGGAPPGQPMVYGHDHSSDPSYPRGLYEFGGPVTEANARALVAAIHAGRAGQQGIGDCQLTSIGLVDRANQLGGVHLPYPNQRAGFEYLADLIRRHGLRGGFQFYNGGASGSAPSVAYGRRSEDAVLRLWRPLIAATSTTPPPAGEDDLDMDDAQMDKLAEKVGAATARNLMYWQIPDYAGPGRPSMQLQFALGWLLAAVWFVRDAVNGVASAVSKVFTGGAGTGQ